MKVVEILFYFGISFVFTFVFKKMFIEKISKTKFFKKKEDVELIKKTCIQELHKNKRLYNIDWGEEM